MKPFFNIDESSIKRKRVQSAFNNRTLFSPSNSISKINQMNKNSNFHITNESKILKDRKSRIQSSKNKYNFTNKSSSTKKWRFSDEPMWKKFLRGKLLCLLKNNIILCEKKFNPLSFTESISHGTVKEFKNKFRNLDCRNRVGIFTNKFPSILNQNYHFYTRYFDNFISPDEFLNKYFTKQEIYEIKADPVYFNFGGKFDNVDFFKKKSLKETLNEEEKIGTYKLLDDTMKKSLKRTKKRIKGYLDYYTSIMSKQGFIQ